MGELRNFFFFLKGARMHRKTPKQPQNQQVSWDLEDVPPESSKAELRSSPIHSSSSRDFWVNCNGAMGESLPWQKRVTGGKTRFTPFKSGSSLQDPVLIRPPSGQVPHHQAQVRGGRRGIPHQPRHLTHNPRATTPWGLWPETPAG